jgi:ribonuclease HI
MRDPHLSKILETYHAGPQTGVFTDGSAIPNPGPGGWGFVHVIDGEIIAEKNGAEPETTNNRMELTGLIEAVSSLALDEPATIYTDSNLCVQTINEWAAAWERNGWKRKTGPIANLELVKRLYAECRRRPKIKLAWVKAHNGWLWNEYADALSTKWARS